MQYFLHLCLCFNFQLSQAEGFNFDEDVSMIPLTHMSQLWIPLKATTMKAPGMAVVVPLAAEGGAIRVIEIPRTKTSECKYPHDSGSAVVKLPDGNPAIAILSSRYCGMQIYNPDELDEPVFESMPDIDHAFEYGEVSHPFQHIHAKLLFKEFFLHIFISFSFSFSSTLTLFSTPIQATSIT